LKRFAGRQIDQLFVSQNRFLDERRPVGLSGRPDLDLGVVVASSVSKIGAMAGDQRVDGLASLAGSKPAALWDVQRARSHGRRRPKSENDFTLLVPQPNSLPISQRVPSRIAVVHLDAGFLV
jgi:hypothetical protein